MISQKTAYDIACAHQEIEKAQKLLDKVKEAVDHRKQPDIRDAFGYSQGGLQLGVPSGENSTRLYMVEWSLCVPVLTAHIGHMRAKLAALNEVARSELDCSEATHA
jgi:hypothetical protein